MNVLFIPLNKKETRLGFVIAGIYLLTSFFLEATGNQLLQLLLLLPMFAAVAIVGRRFFKETFTCLPLTGKQLIWKPLLAVLGHRAVCFLVHDLFLLLEFPYFTASDWGPVLWDIRVYLLETHTSAHQWLTAVCLVILAPIVEEFLFRGVILGTLYPKRSALAVIFSVALFAALHTLPYVTHAFSAMGSDAALYLCLYAFSYIPMGLFLTWLYISTDSIFAPMIMHMIINYGLVF